MCRMCEMNLVWICLIANTERASSGTPKPSPRALSGGLTFSSCAFHFPSFISATVKNLGQVRSNLPSLRGRLNAATLRDSCIKPCFHLRVARFRRYLGIATLARYSRFDMLTCCTGLEQVEIGGSDGALRRGARSDDWIPLLACGLVDAATCNVFMLTSRTSSLSPKRSEVSSSTSLAWSSKLSILFELNNGSTKWKGSLSRVDGRGSLRREKYDKVWCWSWAVSTATVPSVERGVDSPVPQPRLVSWDKLFHRISSEVLLLNRPCSLRMGCGKLKRLLDAVGLT